MIKHPSDYFKTEYYLVPSHIFKVVERLLQQYDNEEMVSLQGALAKCEKLDPTSIPLTDSHVRNFLWSLQQTSMHLRNAITSLEVTQAQVKEVRE